MKPLEKVNNDLAKIFTDYKTKLYDLTTSFEKKLRPTDLEFEVYNTLNTELTSALLFHAISLPEAHYKDSVTLASNWGWEFFLLVEYTNHLD